MTIQGKFGAHEYDDQKVSGGHHPAVLLSGLLAVGVGVLPLGLLLARDVAGKLIGWAEDIQAVLGEGDGTEKTFVFDLGGPVVPGSVGIDDGVEAFTDDGFGTLTGDGATTPGSGKVDYATGKGTVTFKTAPLALAEVGGTWTPRFAGVLAEGADLAATGSANYVVHGSVRRAALKVPDTEGYKAPSAAQLSELAKLGIYPE